MDLTNTASKLRVVMLCGDGPSSRIMYHGIAQDVECLGIILENGVSPIAMTKRRAARLGYWRTTGQVAFILLNKILKKFDDKRIRRVMDEASLNDSDFPSHLVIPVKTINDDAVSKKIVDLGPDLVIVNGTRIIGKELLNRLPAPVVNTHMGVTPRYRGVHGGYWAMVNDDRENCGVTVHMVDEGIDTGGVLYQTRISPTDDDTFNTYPLLQIAAAISLMKCVVYDASAGELERVEGVSPSKLWYHPTIWQYFYYWVVSGYR